MADESYSGGTASPTRWVDLNLADEKYGARYREFQHVTERKAVGFRTQCDLVSVEHHVYVGARSLGPAAAVRFRILRNIRGVKNPHERLPTDDPYIPLLQATYTKAKTIRTAAIGDYGQHVVLLDHVKLPPQNEGRGILERVFEEEIVGRLYDHGLNRIQGGWSLSHHT